MVSNSPQVNRRQLTVAGFALALAAGPAFAVDHTISASNFTMIDNTGSLVGGATDVNGTFDDTLICTAESCSDISMTLQSSQPFFGLNWVAHDIRTFSEGSYSFDTNCTSADIAAGTTDCGGGAPLALTVGPGQLGAHMLFDWGVATDIDVAVVWNIDDSFGSPIYSAAGTPDEDSTQTPDRVWNLASKDGNGDGIQGIPMVDGAFVGFSANFNLDMEPPFALTPPESPLMASVLPSSRAVTVGAPATAFATIINNGAADATGCDIAPVTAVDAAFQYQTTDAANNLTGTLNTPADIPAGGQQNYVFGFTPNSGFDPTIVEFAFDCASISSPADVKSGLNTLLLSASTTAIADIVAISATVNNDGYVDIPDATGTGIFAVAAVNVGSVDNITVSSTLSDTSLPVTVLLCETDAAGACLADPSPTVTTSIDNGETPSFGAFVTGSGTVTDDPAANRISVQFEDSAAVVRGATSVAVRTQAP